MADAEHHELIIIKRHEDEEHDHHSSAWKVAHADFMTAMMAFFLIMWLINVTDEEVRKSIANYFNPVKLSASVTNRKGLNDPEDIHPDGSGEVGDAKTRLDSTPSENDGESAKPAPGEPSEATHEQEPAEHESGRTQKPAPGAHEASAEEEKEHAAFSDPYAVLAELAAEVPPAEALRSTAAIGDTGATGAESGEAYRDPFDPIYWQMAPGDSARTSAPGPVEMADDIPAEGMLDAAAPRDAASAMAEMRSTLSEMLTAESPPPAAEPPLPEEQAEAAMIETELTAALKERLGSMEAPTVEVRVTDEGILISLTDDMDFSMFEIGSAVPKPVVVVAMEKVAEILAGRTGDIVVRGYTDGRPFRSETYDNWRLSTARAHMASYMLTRGGLPEGRIHKIEGFADRNLKNPADPNAAENRRIEILLQELAA